MVWMLLAVPDMAAAEGSALLVCALAWEVVDAGAGWETGDAATGVAGLLAGADAAGVLAGAAGELAGALTLVAGAPQEEQNFAFASSGAPQDEQNMANPFLEDGWCGGMLCTGLFASAVTPGSS